MQPSPELTSSSPPDLPALAAHLDGLSHEARLSWVRSLGAKAQARLFEAAQGFRKVDLLHFVPEGTAPLAEVIHHGKNSLPAFTLFQKRFCRVAGGAELAGYNEQAMRWATGPGYFVARPFGDGEVLIDYLALPAERAPSWPPVKPNSAGLSRFVYHRTQDVMRGVSRHVTIGRATREGKPMDNWFLLCREDGAAAPSPT